MLDGLTPDLAPRLVLAIGGVGVAFLVLIFVLLVSQAAQLPSLHQGRQGARAASDDSRCRRGRSEAPSGADPPRRCRAPDHDRRPDRYRHRDRHRRPPGGGGREGRARRSGIACRCKSDRRNIPEPSIEPRLTPVATPERRPEPAPQPVMRPVERHVPVQAEARVPEQSPFYPRSSRLFPRPDLSWRKRGSRNPKSSWRRCNPSCRWRPCPAGTSSRLSETSRPWARCSTTKIASR